MTIPYSLNILICIVTFVVAVGEYYWVDPHNRVMNRYFGLAVGAVVMAIVNIFMRDPAPSLWLFLLAAVWCGVTLYQIRLLPERPDRRR
jgi:FtsH-binding integral membrane protein